MNFIDAAARGIMRLATYNPPPDRADWAQAMEGEFEAAEESRLGWALGCLRATSAWKLRIDGIFVALLLLVPYKFEQLLHHVEYFSSMIGMPRSRAFAIEQFWMLLNPMFVSAIFGYFRPSYRGVIAVLIGLLPLLIGDIRASLAYSMPIADFWRIADNVNLYNAPVPVGLCAILGVCYFGASLGARIAGQRSIN